MSLQDKIDDRRLACRQVKPAPNTFDTRWYWARMASSLPRLVDEARCKVGPMPPDKRVHERLGLLQLPPLARRKIRVLVWRISESTTVMSSSKGTKKPISSASRVCE